MKFNTDERLNTNENEEFKNLVKDAEKEPIVEAKAERYLLPGGWYNLIAILGMTQGFVWTYFVSGLMIDALGFVGLLTKLSATYLALTVIAVGNALPDALLTVSQAGSGKAVLGLTGGYSG
jgi:Ca2+/Na+ antiporter